MLSVDYIKANREWVALCAKNKNREVDLDKIIALDEQKKKILRDMQLLQEERNLASKSKPSDEVIKRGKIIKEEITALEESLRKLEQSLRELLLQVPNVIYSGVPVGKDETENIVEFEKPPTKHEFTSKDHVQILEDLNLADLERGSKIAGFRGYFLRGHLAKLHMAVLMNAFELISSKGYMPLIAPSFAKEFAFYGNAQFPWGRREVYELEKDDLFLSGSAEVPVTALYANEILNEKDLPLKFVALSPCFRREAGSHGKDTRGLYRVHEFWKVEQLIITNADETNSRALHQELQENIEAVMDSLELPYRRLLMCTGDMGEAQMFKFDTEVYLPGSKRYCELGSNSILGDFQSRRLNIRYRDKNGDLKFVHTLNNTATASPRALVALLENHQQKDGRVYVPQVLRKWGLGEFVCK